MWHGYRQTFVPWATVTSMTTLHIKFHVVNITTGPQETRPTIRVNQDALDLAVFRLKPSALAASDVLPEPVYEELLDEACRSTCKKGKLCVTAFRLFEVPNAADGYDNATAVEVMFVPAQD
ncbi:hypothetical protein Q5752_005446 [Cryptotrichosporon argae]